MQSVSCSKNFVSRTKMLFVVHAIIRGVLTSYYALSTYQFWHINDLDSIIKEREKIFLIQGRSRPILSSFSTRGIYFFNVLLAIKRKKIFVISNNHANTSCQSVLDGRYNRVELLTSNFCIKALNILRDVQLDERDVPWCSSVVHEADRSNSYRGRRRYIPRVVKARTILPPVSFPFLTTLPRINRPARWPLFLIIPSPFPITVSRL